MFLSTDRSSGEELRDDNQTGGGLDQRPETDEQAIHGRQVLGNWVSLIFSQAGT